MDNIFNLRGKLGTRLEKISKYYHHVSLKIFLLLFMSLLTASLVKNSRTLAGIYFILLKNVIDQT